MPAARGLLGGGTLASEAAPEGAGRGPGGRGGPARGSVLKSSGRSCRRSQWGGGGWAARGADWLAPAS